MLRIVLVKANKILGLMKGHYAPKKKRLLLKGEEEKRGRKRGTVWGGKHSEIIGVKECIRGTQVCIPGAK